MNKYFISNWKMNKDKDDVLCFFDKLNRLNFAWNRNIEYLIAASDINIYLSQLLNKTKIKIIGQDVSQFAKGSYTGQNSAKTLASYDVEYCIIGHSETRKYFNVNDEAVNLKVKECLENNIKPIICVGEDKEIYDNNQTKKFIVDQIRKCLDGIDDDQEVIIAYEPLWAIGTGLTPELDEIENITTLIKQTFDNVDIVYGGSVNKNNIKDILSIDTIDGVLVGNASLNVDDYIDLIKEL